VVGSRRKKVRECATAKQWDEMGQQQRAGLILKQFNGDPSDRPLRDGGKDTPG
jgi:hypothetical protein